MNKFLKFLLFFTSGVAIICVILVFSGVAKIGDFFKPVSVVSKVITEGDLKKTDGKTNFLLVGIDKRSTNGVSSGLTDTIIMASLDSTSKKAVMVSIPRDLWIDANQTKINAIYPLSRNKKDSNGQPIDPIVPVMKAVETVTGMPIHYYVLVDFEVFKQTIDAIGGIEVDVQNTFDDFQYPIEGKEDAMPESSRYEHLHFNKGKQTFNGEIALKYARSRHSSNPAEAGDFNRARRQQQVIEAVKNKLMSSSTLLNPAKLTALYDSVKSNIQTNVDAADMLLMYKNYGAADFGEISKIVLSNENAGENAPLGAGTLEAPDEERRHRLYNGAYVLAPKSGSFEEIHTLIRSQIFR